MQGAPVRACWRRSEGVRRPRLVDLDHHARAVVGEAEELPGRRARARVRGAPDGVVVLDEALRAEVRLGQGIAAQVEEGEDAAANADADRAVAAGGVVDGLLEDAEGDEAGDAGPGRGESGIGEMNSSFNIEAPDVEQLQSGKKIILTCFYCEKIFDRDQVGVNI